MTRWNFTWLTCGAFLLALGCATQPGVDAGPADPDGTGGNEVSLDGFVPGEDSLDENTSEIGLAETQDGELASPDAGEGDQDGQSEVDATSPLDTLVELPADHEPPDVSWVWPEDGATISGEVVLEVQAQDGNGVASVELYLDGTLLAELSQEPFTFTWDLTDLVSGNYLLVVVVLDGAGNRTEEGIEVHVKATCGEDEDCPPEGVTLVTPLAGATVCGELTVEATAQDDQGVVQVEFFVDDESLGVDDAAPFQRQWDTSKASAGPHVVKAVARDGAGQEAFTKALVTVLNSADSCDNLPGVVLDSPLNEAHVRGQVEVTARASDDHGVDRVLFFADEEQIAEVKTAPFKATWKTLEFSEGTHTLMVKAFDTADQMATHQVQVTVDRAPPTLEIRGPDPALPNHDLVALQVDVSDNFLLRTVTLEGDFGSETLEGPPFGKNLDVTGWTAGSYEYRVTAEDGAGNQGIVTSSFLVDRLPLISFVEPAEGAVVYGEVPVALAVLEDLAVAEVTLEVDGVEVARVDGGEELPQPLLLWPAPYAKGTHEFVARVVDGSAQEALASMQVLVDHPVTVTLKKCTTANSCQALVANQTLSGTVQLRAFPLDDGAGFKQVEFLVDGAPVGTLMAAPFLFQWDSAGVTDGAHVLKAIATNDLDETGEVAVGIRVSNCDQDADSYPAASCGGPDCDDANPSVNPVAGDLLGDGKDSNCDGVDGVDVDQDGWVSKASGGDDCNDMMAAVHPCADDLAGDGVDANCDGTDVASCDDCRPCTADSLGEGGCTHDLIPESGACDDKDPCTIGETCVSDNCEGGVFTEGLPCAAGGVCLEDRCAPACEVAKGNAGCKFHAVDLDNYGEAASASFGVMVMNTSTTATATVTVTDPEGEILQQVVQPGGGATFSLAAYWGLSGSAVGKQAFVISSNQPITAFQFNPLTTSTYSNDGTVLLPDARLGSEYFVSSYKGINSFFTIVATSAAPVLVDVTVSGATAEGTDLPALLAGESDQRWLQPGEVWNVETPASTDLATMGDLTGSRVTATGPVAVHAGNSCSGTGGQCCCDHLEHQLMPVETWGHQVLVARTSPRWQEKDYVRILAARDGTQVTLQPATLGPVPPLDAGQYFSFQTDSDVLVVSDDPAKPVQVTQYLASALEILGPKWVTGSAGCASAADCPEGYDCAYNDMEYKKTCMQRQCSQAAQCPSGHTCSYYGFCNPLGDPAMILAVPTHQFQTRYWFVTPPNYRSDFVNVVAPVGTTLVTLDGLPIPLEAFTALGTSGYGVYRASVNDGFHTLVADLPVGLTVYGYHEQVAYGYAGGMGLSPGPK